MASSVYALSPVSVTTARGTPLGTLPAASPPQTDGQEEYAEAQESQSWLEEDTSSVSSIRSNRSKSKGSRKKSITTASGSYVESIDWVFIPASVSVSNGPYSLEVLQTKLDISVQKVSVRSLPPTSVVLIPMNSFGTSRRSCCDVSFAFC